MIKLVIMPSWVVSTHCPVFDTLYRIDKTAKVLLQQSKTDTLVAIFIVLFQYFTKIFYFNKKDAQKNRSIYLSMYIL